jgi:hypothetical protein
MAKPTVYLTSQAAMRGWYPAKLSTIRFYIAKYR